MNLKMFYDMSTDEATRLLHDFLVSESREFEAVRDAMSHDGLNIGLSLETIPPTIAWLAMRLEVKQLPDDDQVTPRWLRESEVFKKNHFALSDDTAPLVFVGGYYIGQAFCARYPFLKWSIGHPDYACKNMPVVVGFAREMEMSPLLISETQMRGILVGASSSATVARAVEFWSELAVAKSRSQ